jgi:uncharacterized protein
VLHGFPGYERNLDLAQAFRRAGWNAMVFHYRGSWGSDGSFSFSHVLEDAIAALKHVRSGALGEAGRVDPERLALVGHSMGGWAALMTAAEDEGLLGAASIAGWNIGRVARQLLEGGGSAGPVLAMIDTCVVPLSGTSASALIKEASGRGDTWDLCAFAGRLATMPTLLVGAMRDDEVPPEIHHYPLVEAMKQAAAKHLAHEMVDTDHAFSDRRVALARLTCEWLGSLQA